MLIVCRRNPNKTIVPLRVYEVPTIKALVLPCYTMKYHRDYVRHLKLIDIGFKMVQQLKVQRRYLRTQKPKSKLYCGETMKSSGEFQEALHPMGLGLSTEYYTLYRDVWSRLASRRLEPDYDDIKILKGKASFMISIPWIGDDLRYSDLGKNIFVL